MKLSQFARGCHGWFNNIFERVPKLPETKTNIGISVDGKPISSYMIGNGKHAVLFCGAIHGNEVGTSYLMHHLLKWLHDHPRMISNLTCHVIPCLNPDGFDHALHDPEYFNWGKVGRLNAHHVDLNRNFPTASWKSEARWNHGKEYLETSQVSAGPKPGSEPEVRSFISFVHDNNIQAMIMFHSLGSDVMGNDCTLATFLAKEYARKAHFRCLPNDHWHQLHQTGTAVEWCNEQGIACIEVEASQRWGSDWKRQQRALVASIDVLNSHCFCAAGC